MNLNFAKPSVLERWGFRCYLAIMIGVGLTTACLGAQAAYRGHTGLVGMLTAIPFFFIFGSGVSYLGLDLLLRLFSLGRYLWVYGFSAKGLTVDSPSDDSPTK